jgi:hypothetical protein
MVEVVVLFLDIVVVVVVEVAVAATKLLVVRGCGTKLLPATTASCTRSICMKYPTISRCTLTCSEGLTVSALARVSQEFGLDDQAGLADSDGALMDFEELLIHLVEKKTSALESHSRSGI